VVFEANYDEIELQKYSYDVISVTHQQYVAENRNQNNATKFFLQYGPPPIKISGYASE